MKTYQDFLAVPDNDTDRMAFVRSVISDHTSSELCRTAKDAYEYFKENNVTIANYQKTLVTASGNIVLDKWSPNHKVKSGFFKRFVTQQNQYLLGNGITWGQDTTADKLGKRFDTKMQRLGQDALIGAVSFGFWNKDHLEVFKVTEFAPLLDEENGSLRMGVRFWQIDAKKPLRATLYEEDGYTEYIWNAKDGKEAGQILKPKRAYVTVRTRNDAEGELSVGDKNYSGFPIIPLWANSEHISELEPIKDGIDAYDLIKNGFENDLDSAQIYWIIKGAGGMDSQDLVQFLDRLATNKIASLEGDQEINAHEINLPYQAREVLLDRIEKDLYRDYMALNTDEIKSGSVVNAQIKAAYEAMNSKADGYEYQIIDFLDNLLEIVGVDDEPTFTRSMLVNGMELITTLIQAGEYLSKEYITTKILTILGDADMVDEVLKQMDAEELAMSGLGKSEEENEPDTETPENVPEADSNIPAEE